MTSDLREGHFNRLEMAVLDVVAAQYPAHRAALLRQFRAARVTGRRNTGAGFFTGLAIDRATAAPVPLPSPVGNVWAEIDRFRDPVTFLVLLQDGYAATLEGAAIRDDTTGIDFGRIGFSLVS